MRTKSIRIMFAQRPRMMFEMRCRRFTQWGRQSPNIVRRQIAEMVRSTRCVSKMQCLKISFELNNTNTKESQQAMALQEYIKYRVCKEFLGLNDEGFLLFAFNLYESKISSKTQYSKNVCISYQRTMRHQQRTKNEDTSESKLTYRREQIKPI